MNTRTRTHRKHIELHILTTEHQNSSEKYFEKLLYIRSYNAKDCGTQFCSIVHVFKTDNTSLLNKNSYKKNKN